MFFTKRCLIIDPLRENKKCFFYEEGSIFGQLQINQIPLPPPKKNSGFPQGGGGGVKINVPSIFYTGFENLGAGRNFKFNLWTSWQHWLSFTISQKFIFFQCGKSKNLASLLHETETWKCENISFFLIFWLNLVVCLAEDLEWYFFQVLKIMKVSSIQFFILDQTKNTSNIEQFNLRF